MKNTLQSFQKKNFDVINSLFLSFYCKIKNLIIHLDNNMVIQV